MAEAIEENGSQFSVDPSGRNTPWDPGKSQGQMVATLRSPMRNITRWGRWEDILHDPDLEIGPEQPACRKQPSAHGQEEPPEWVLYTDGSQKGPDQAAYWGFILKQHDKERCRQKGKTPGSAQAGEALKEDLSIWEENGFETAKGKQVAHHDLWKKIAELRLDLDLQVEHQRAHTRDGAHWRGNDEVNRYVQQRRIVFVGIEKWDRTLKGRVVPDVYVDEVVRSVHEALGHAGVLPTRKELEEQELWVPLKHIRRVLRGCEVCGRYNAGRRGQRTDGLTIKSTVPWGSVCIDVAGPMGMTGKRGEKYLLVLVKQVLDWNTVLLHKKGIQGVEQLKPVLS
ncbi:uncharacterized protein V3H82_002118 [Fundulus diaphanus]